MPHVTAILGQEVGIQYQGVKDASSLIGAYPISGVIVGSFRRGRLDQPMTITRENIKAKLGYDPTNPDYLVVQDALDSGVPSVQVLRVIPASDSGAGDIEDDGNYNDPTVPPYDGKVILVERNDYNIFHFSVSINQLEPITQSEKEEIRSQFIVVGMNDVHIPNNLVFLTPEPSLFELNLTDYPKNLSKKFYVYNPKDFNVYPISDS